MQQVVCNGLRSNQSAPPGRTFSEIDTADAVEDLVNAIMRTLLVFLHIGGKESDKSTTQVALVSHFENGME